MMDYSSLARRYGYTQLFECSGSVNKDFVDKLDKFFLNGGAFFNHCDSTFGDNRRIIEFLNYSKTVLDGSPSGSEDIQKFDMELATWNK